MSDREELISIINAMNADLPEFLFDQGLEWSFCTTGCCSWSIAFDGTNLCDSETAVTVAITREFLQQKLSDYIADLQLVLQTLAAASSSPASSPKQ